MKTLKSLFESDLLNDDTKVVLQEAWDTALQAKTDELEVVYAEKLNEAQTELSTQATQMIEEAIADEMEAISDELMEARTLEIRYANKLNEFKDEYDVKMQEQLKEMVGEVVGEEMAEIKEDIDFAKKNQFGLSIFESFQEIYKDTFGGEDFEAKTKLEEATKELDALRREKVLDGLVESLTDDSKRVALTILEGVATENLEKRFESLRPILLKENEEEEEAPLTEGKEAEVPKGKVVLESEEVAESQEKEIDPQVAKMIARSLAYGRNKK